MCESHDQALVDDCTVCEGSWLEYSQSFPINLCKNFCQESNRGGFGALCHFLGDNVYSEGGLNYTFVLLPFLTLYIASWFILEMRGPKACIASIWKSGGRWFQAKDGWAGEMRPFGERLKYGTVPYPKNRVRSRVKVSHICLIFWTCLVLVGGRSLG